MAALRPATDSKFQAVGTQWSCAEILGNGGLPLPKPDQWLLHFWRNSRPPRHPHGQSWRFYATPYTLNGMDARTSTKIGFDRKTAYVEYKRVCAEFGADPRPIQAAERWVRRTVTGIKHRRRPLPLKWRTTECSAAVRFNANVHRAKRRRVHKETKVGDTKARMRSAVLVASVLGVTRADRMRKVVQLQATSAAAKALELLFSPANGDAEKPAQKRRRIKRTNVRGVGRDTTLAKLPVSFRSSADQTSMSTDLRARRAATRAIELSLKGVGGNISALTYDPQQGPLRCAALSCPVLYCPALPPFAKVATTLTLITLTHLALERSLAQHCGMGLMTSPQIPPPASFLAPPPQPNFNARIELISPPTWLGPRRVTIVCQEHYTLNYIASAVYKVTGMLPGRLFFFNRSGEAVRKSYRIGRHRGRTVGADIAIQAAYRGSVISGLPKSFVWGADPWPARGVQFTVLPPFQPRWSLGTVPQPHPDHEKGIVDPIPLIALEGQEWWDGFTAHSKSFVAGKFKMLDRARVVSKNGSFPVAALHVIGASEPSAYTEEAIEFRTKSLDTIQYDNNGPEPRVHYYPRHGSALFAFWMCCTCRAGDCSAMTKETGIRGGKSNVSRCCTFCDAPYGTFPATTSARAQLHPSVSHAHTTAGLFPWAFSGSTRYMDDFPRARAQASHLNDELERIWKDGERLPAAMRELMDMIAVLPSKKTKQVKCAADGKVRKRVVITGGAAAFERWRSASSGATGQEPDDEGEDKDSSQESEESDEENDGTAKLVELADVVGAAQRLGAPSAKVREYIRKRIDKDIGGDAKAAPPAPRTGKYGGEPELNLPSMHVLKSVQSSVWGGITKMLRMGDGLEREQQRAQILVEADASKKINSGGTVSLNRDVTHHAHMFEAARTHVCIPCLTTCTHMHTEYERPRLARTVPPAFGR
jgi:hypothetical protein